MKPNVDFPKRAKNSFIYFQVGLITTMLIVLFILKKYEEIESMKRPHSISFFNENNLIDSSSCRIILLFNTDIIFNPSPFKYFLIKRVLHPVKQGHTEVPKPTHDFLRS